MNTDDLSQLTSLLKTQCELLANLSSVSRRQREALLSGDQPGVEATTKAQDELLAALQRCEAERLALMETSFGADVSLQQLIERAPRDVGGELAALRERAKAQMDELTGLNETNAELLKQELALIHLYMSVLHPDGGGELYAPPTQGKRPTGGAPMAFDTRA